MTNGVGEEYRLGYRGDVEGLRAVAILLVVACHASVTWLAGGFIGVDVFYVLSGYLITGLLVQEIATNGRLNFANFYARRLRRLMPALLLMLLVACVLCRLLMPPYGQHKQAMAATSAALWLSNFYFGFMQLDYFGPAAKSILFLHTWSLGVEEQFYLVWPLLAVVAMGVWRGTKRQPTLTRLRWLFGTVFILTFALSLYWTWHAPRLAFYMMPARAWQFALGGLAFLVVGTPRFPVAVPALGKTWSIVAGWLGLALIMVPALLIDGRVPYPGWWALMPTVGTALVVVGVGAQGSWYSANRWLATLPMQSLGRVSYSWYLWHWPVLLIGAQLVDTRAGWTRLLLVMVSLLIATASYRFFETPIRRNRHLLARPRRVVAAGLVIIVCAGLAGLTWYHATKVRDANPTLSAYVDAPIVYRMGCDQWYHSAAVRPCEFGDPHAAHVAISFGDSVSTEWVPAYMRLFDRPGWRLIVFTKSSCPSVNVPIYDPWPRRIDVNCIKWRHDVIQRITELRPDVVLTSTIYDYGFTRAEWINGSRAVFKKLAVAAKQVFVLRSTPRSERLSPDCVVPRSWLYTTIMGRSPACTSPANTPESDEVFRWITKAAAPFRNVQVMDLTDAYCPGGICHAVVDGRAMFRDDHHFTATFAASLAPTLAKALDLSLKPANQVVAGTPAKAGATSDVHTHQGPGG